jgi:hypothetical protein
MGKMAKSETDRMKEKEKEMGEAMVKDGSS